MDAAQDGARGDEVRRMIVLFALVAAVAAAVADPAPAGEVALAAFSVATFAGWAGARRMPLAALVAGVLLPVVLAQRAGALEPVMFEASLLAFVGGRWASSVVRAVAVGGLAAATPLVVGLVQSPSEVSAGIWAMGIAFPWVIGRAVARQAQLAAQLDAARGELAERALADERRRIARDVHDFVGHGLAAVLVQVASARHVLHRDPALADEALRSAEEAGRRSMRELRRTMALLRSDGEGAAVAPLPSALQIEALVDEARAGGQAVELQLGAGLSEVTPSVGVALYRIAQEALANAARHAPRARTVVRLELDGDSACLDALSAGPRSDAADSEPDRPRYGVIGMRERAAALGGELSAGPTTGGWSVRCRLPLEAAGAGEAGPR